MKEIRNLNSVRIHHMRPEEPKIPLDLEAGYVRIPLLFLVDVSGSMDEFLPQINRTLTDLMGDIYRSNSAEKYMIDFAIITFGGNGVVVEREFDLLRKNERFQIQKCDGETPLGEAMLRAYCYAAQRKRMYRQNLCEYKQPVVALITDFWENNSHDVEIDGIPYSGATDSLFREMAELYTEAHQRTFKQFTYAIALGRPGTINMENRELLKVEHTDSETLDIAKILRQVIQSYVASIPDQTEQEVINAVSHVSEDIHNSVDIILKWQDEAMRNPLKEGDEGDE